MYAYNRAERQRSRFGDHVDLPRAGAAELRGVRAGLDLKFTDCIRRRADDECVERRVGIDRAVEQIAVRVGASTADRNRGHLTWPPVEGAHIAHLRPVERVVQERARHPRTDGRSAALRHLLLIDDFATVASLTCSRGTVALRRLLPTVANSSDIQPHLAGYSAMRFVSLVATLTSTASCFA